MKEHGNDYNTNPVSYGGIIYINDFNTEDSGEHTLFGSRIAQRIMEDQEFVRYLLSENKGRSGS